MINTDHYILFSILRSALENKPMSDREKNLITEDIMQYVMRMAAKHDITQLIALGAKNNRLVHAEQEVRLQQIIFKAAYRCERIKYELSKICETLEKAKIPFIPLKGSVIRAHYPEQWMRMSCDIDILVHEQDLHNAVDSLVNGLKYEASNRVDYHDISLFSPSGVHLELHFSIKENMDRIDHLLSEVWEYARAEKDGGFCYDLTPEFFVFYHIAHMAHHFVRGGCGIKPFIDMHIMKSGMDYNDTEVRSLCRQCGLEKFYDHMLCVTDVWFKNEPHNVKSRQIEDYILKGGVYGTLENKVMVAQGKEGSKLRYALSRVFISYDSLKNYYPILTTRKWLFPIMQIRRWFRLIFIGGLKRGVQEMRVNQNISQEQAERMYLFLSDIGL